jgi:hypothetical protein
MFQAGDIAMMLGALTFGGAALWCSRLLRARQPAVVPTPPVAVGAEFRRRQSRCVRYGFAPAGVGFAVMFIGGSSGPGFGARTIAVIGFLTFVGGVFYLHAVYRCPACESTLTDDDGMIMFPTSCHRCGALFE